MHENLCQIVVFEVKNQISLTIRKQVEQIRIKTPLSSIPLIDGVLF